MIWRSRKRSSKKDDLWHVERQKGSPLLALVALGLVAAIFYGLFELVSGFTFSTGGGAPAGFPDALPYFVVGAIVASCAVGVGLFLSAKEGARPKLAKTPGGDKIDQGEFAEVLGETSRALGRGSDFRAAILGCYRAICQILDREGTVDSSKLTAREFESLVASRVKVDERYLHEATLLFEKARYSIDQLYDQDAKRAEFCLQRLAEEAQPGGPQPMAGMR